MAVKKKAGKAKAAAKKPAAKKGKVKTKAKAKAAAPKLVVNKAPAKARMSKANMFNEIAEAIGLTRKHVSAVFEQLENIVDRHIKKGAVGEFVLPGLLKITTVKKPARKARKGINPFTGQEQMFKARPASIAVRARPLKKLKEMAQ